MFNPTTMLVTGGAGFIGSHFVRHILSNGDVAVINLDKLTYAGSKENLADVLDHERHHFIEGDICDEVLVASLFRKYSVNCIVHFAAESHVDRSIAGPKAFVQTNVLGTFTLLEAARQFWLEEQRWDSTQCRFHHISTDEVFGSLKEGDAAFTEMTPYAPNSPYSATKAGSDHLVRAYHHTYGLPTTMSNCSNNYGPHQHAEKLIPTVIRKCYKGEKIPVYGDGSNVRDWLHVQDHCHAVARVVQQGMVGECYNIGSNNEQSNLTIVKWVTKIMDELYPKHAPHDRLIEFVDDRLGHDWRYAINGHKIQQALGWQAMTSFEEGLRATVDCFSTRFLP